MEELFSVYETARILKVGTVTVRKWIRDGKLKAYKIGGMRLLRVKRVDLRAFLHPGGNGKS